MVQKCIPSVLSSQSLVSSFEELFPFCTFLHITSDATLKQVMDFSDPLSQRTLVF